MRQQTMRTVKHRPITDFELRMSNKNPFHPLIGHYFLRTRGWRQLFETADGLDLTLDCWDSVNELTVARWQSVFNNFDTMVEAALRVIPPPPIDPNRFYIDELVIHTIYLNEPVEFLFNSEYCSEYGEQPEVKFVDGAARFQMWST